MTASVLSPGSRNFRPSPLADITVLQRPAEIFPDYQGWSDCRPRGWRFPPAERRAASRPDDLGGFLYSIKKEGTPASFRLKTAPSTFAANYSVARFGVNSS